MDDAVLRSLAKWPDVPAAYGWLALDRRGNWSIKGERIANRTVIAFIGRNYGCDPRGRWFFQNGPQRVYVSLAYTPFVARTEPSTDGLHVRTHTGTEFVPGSAWLDDAGNLLVGVDHTVAMIHDQDLSEALGCLRRSGGAPLTDTELEEMLIGKPLPGDVVLVLGGVARPVARLEAATMAQRFAFEPNPRPDPGEPEC